MADDSENIELACQHCGERNPANFSVCWNCGQSLDEAERVAAAELVDKSEEITVSQAATDKPFGRWTGWCELTGVLLLTFVNQVVKIWIRGNWGTYRTAPIDIAALLATIPRYLGISLVLWILIRRDRSIAQPIALRDCNWFYEFGFAILIMGANLWLVRFVGRVVAIDGLTDQRSAPYLISGTALWAAQAVRWFFSSTYEELLFRAYLQPIIQSLTGSAALGIVISAFIFAVGHGYPFGATLQVVAMGLLFGAIYHFNRRVPRLVLGHWMYNLLVAYLRQH